MICTVIIAVLHASDTNTLYFFLNKQDDVLHLNTGHYYSRNYSAMYIYNYYGFKLNYKLIMHTELSN